MRLEDLHKLEQGREGWLDLIKTLATNIFSTEYQPKFEISTQLFNRDSTNWITFVSEVGNFAIGIGELNFRLAILIPLLECLRLNLHPSFVLHSDLFMPEQFGAFQASSVAVLLPQGSKQLICAWSKGMSEPRMKLLQKLKYRVKLELALVLDCAFIVGNFCINCDLQLQACSAAFSGCLGQFTFIRDKQILRFDGVTYMESIERIAAQIKIGSIELTLEQLMTLEVGSQFKFILAAETPIELEIGGNTFAFGVMKQLSEAKFSVELSRMNNSI